MQMRNSVSTNLTSNGRRPCDIFILHLLGEKQVEGATALYDSVDAILGGGFIFCQAI